MIIYPVYPISGIQDHTKKFDVSVIVPLYKSNEVIVDQINSWCLDEKYSVEVIYVDDCCPNKTKSTISREWNKRKDKHKFDAKLVIAVKNNGFAGACNLGARHSTSKYLIFLNADTVVTPNWISPMIDLFQDPSVGIVGNLQIKEGGEFDGTIDSAGSEWSWEFMNFMHIGRHFYNGEPLKKPLFPQDAPKDIMSVGEREMVTGCCFAIQRDLFNEVCGFNQGYRIGYWEDTELNLVIRSLGYKVMFQPNSVIYHKLSHSNVGLHQFHNDNKSYFINNWINNYKLDRLVKDKRSDDLIITPDCIDRIYSSRMTFYRQTYKNSKRWDGTQSLEGKRIIVYCEQGLGDTIQFVRYVSELKKKNCYVILHCANQLHKILLNHLDGIDEVFNKDDSNVPDHDYHALSMSLPFILNNPPTEHPYINFNDKIDLESDGFFTIGIAWEGSPDHSNNDLRSCPLKHFKSIANIPWVKLFMIQKQIHLPQLTDECEELDISSVEINDFTDTARLINSVDLIISVDTSVLHLAGALNKKSLGLISEPCDYRWDVKEWYPNVKILKQRTPLQWDSVFEQVVKEVKGLMNENLSA